MSEEPAPPPPPERAPDEAATATPGAATTVPPSQVAYGGGGWASMPGVGSPPRPTRRRPLTRAEVLPALVAAVVLAVVGIPLGLIWGASSPRVNVALAAAGGVESAFKAQVGDDVRFALVSLVAGALAGLVAGLVTRRRLAWLMPLALAVGGIGGAFLASLFGHLQANASLLNEVRARAPDVASRAGDLFEFRLRAYGFVVVYPLAALVVFFLVVLLTTRREQASAPSDAVQPPTDGRWWANPYAPR